MVHGTVTVIQNTSVAISFHLQATLDGEFWAQGNRVKGDTMEQSAIFSATLGLSTPWLVTSVSFAADGNRLDISVDFARGSIFRCPHCGSERQTSSEATETWYHQDYFHHPTYLHARIPRIACCDDVIFPVERPWSRTGSKFALIA